MERSGFRALDLRPLPLDRPTFRKWHCNPARGDGHPGGRSEERGKGVSRGRPDHPNTQQGILQRSIIEERQLSTRMLMLVLREVSLRMRFLPNDGGSWHTEAESSKGLSLYHRLWWGVGQCAPWEQRHAAAEIAGFFDRDP